MDDAARGRRYIDLEQVRKFCLSLPHVTERVRWGNDLLFCIGDKMFAVAGLHAKYPTKLSFKCDAGKVRRTG